MRGVVTYLFLLFSVLIFAQEKEFNPEMVKAEDAYANFKLDNCFFVNSLEKSIPEKKDREDFEESFLASKIFYEDLVFDFVDVLDPATEARLNAQLKAFALETSNQFVVVFADDLCGWSPNQYSYKFAEFWGVGQAKEDNGLVLLFKDKTAQSKGELYIATGRGLEGPIPDISANRIIQEFMIPLLKEGKKVEAIETGLDILMKLAKGEVDQRVEQVTRTNEMPKEVYFFLIIILFILVFAIVRVNKKVNDYARLNNVSKTAAYALLMEQWFGSMATGGLDGSQMGRRSNWNGNVPRGRGGFGGFGGGSSGGGGFGGFGGGSFGGGGAGGSW